MITNTKMLQMLLDGQKSIKNDIKKLEKRLEIKIDENTHRIDKLGLQIANIEDDAPTIEEFDQLENRVNIIEQNLALN